MLGVAERGEGRLVAEMAEDPFQVEEETQSRLVRATRNPVEQIGEPNNWRNPLCSRDPDTHLFRPILFLHYLSFKQINDLFRPSPHLGMKVPWNGSKDDFLPNPFQTGSRRAKNPYQNRGSSGVGGGT